MTCRKCGEPLTFVQSGAYEWWECKNSRCPWYRRRKNRRLREEG